MLYKTKGIVLHFIKYKESSIITKIYTELLGLQSYIVNSVRSHSKQNKIALYQPLNLVDLVVYYKENKNIHRILEIRIDHAYGNIHTNAKKNLIASFLLEILNKTVREETHHSDFFSFIRKSCITFDLMDSQYENFPVQFMLKLSQHLGLAIRCHRLLTDFSSEKISNTQETYRVIDKLISANYTEHIRADHQIRRNILEILINFYKFHVENFGIVHSLPILRQLQ